MTIEKEKVIQYNTKTRESITRGNKDLFQYEKSISFGKMSGSIKRFPNGRMALHVPNQRTVTDGIFPQDEFLRPTFPESDTRSDLVSRNPRRVADRPSAFPLSSATPEELYR